MQSKLEKLKNDVAIGRQKKGQPKKRIRSINHSIQRSNKSQI